MNRRPAMMSARQRAQKLQGAVEGFLLKPDAARYFDEARGSSARCTARMSPTTRSTWPRVAFSRSGGSGHRIPARNVSSS